MLFRTEDVSGTDPILRFNEETGSCTWHINKAELDIFIANKIRDEINGSKKRELISYSQSLATCLLKYNKFVDNELHIFNPNGCIDYILYKTQSGKIKYKTYSLLDRLYGPPMFSKSGCIELLSLVVDVSNNDLLNQYLNQYTGVGKKRFASPEKDSEVVVMNPSNDTVINQYLDAVYLLYALQLKYKFLLDTDIRDRLIDAISMLDDSRFDYCREEKIALIFLIQYLSVRWTYEFQISQGIYDYSKAEFRVPIYYDAIMQFHYIMANSFDDAYNLSLDATDVVSELFWKFCYEFLKQKHSVNTGDVLCWFTD